MVSIYLTKQSAYQAAGLAHCKSTIVLFQCLTILVLSLSGYDVKEGTVVFLNNYELNLSNMYWVDADKFIPERFLSADGLSVVKPEHFIPFSTGKRTCIGQRLLLSSVFAMFTRLVQYYDISADITKIKTYPACVGLPPKTFEIALKPRTV